jgi:streptogramin lyase
MRKYFSHAMIILLLQYVNAAFAQQLTFNHVLDANTSKGSINGIAQDQQGYIWLSLGLGSGGRGGVYRYDGSRTIAFLHDPTNPNSLANNWAECLAIDSSNIVWIGTFGSGLDKYDPATNKFTLLNTIQKIHQA